MQIYNCYVNYPDNYAKHQTQDMNLETYVATNVY